MYLKTLKILKASNLGCLGSYSWGLACSNMFLKVFETASGGQGRFFYLCALPSEALKKCRFANKHVPNTLRVEGSEVVGFRGI